MYSGSYLHFYIAALKHNMYRFLQVFTVTDYKTKLTALTFVKVGYKFKRLNVFWAFDELQITINRGAVFFSTADYVYQWKVRLIHTCPHASNSTDVM